MTQPTAPEVSSRYLLCTSGYKAARAACQRGEEIVLNICVNPSLFVIWTFTGTDGSTGVQKVELYDGIATFGPTSK